MPHPNTPNYGPVAKPRASAIRGLQRLRMLTCFYCGGAGHKLSTCPGVPDGARFSCYECGGVGLFARACQTRAAAVGIRTALGRLRQTFRLSCQDCNLLALCSQLLAQVKLALRPNFPRCFSQAVIKSALRRSMAAPHFSCSPI